MTRTFLFGNNASSSSQNKYLVEFKAGKMTMKDRIVSADKRKGTVFVQQTEDSLMHLCWRDRTTNEVEDDLIIFPDDVVFKKVPECTTGRVFVLKFKSSSRKCFYWLQEPKTDRDNEICSKVNQYLNNPPAHSSRSGGLGTPSQGGLSLPEGLSLGDGDFQDLLNNISHEQLLQILGNLGGSTASLSSILGTRPVVSSRPSTSDSSRSNVETPQPSQPPSVSTTSAVTSTTQASQPTTTAPSSASSSTTTTTTTTAPSSSIQLSDLQNILSGLNVPAAAEKDEKPATEKNVDLSLALTSETLQPFLNNKEFMERLQNLLPPSGEGSAAVTPAPDVENIRSTVQSPQFQQALSQFSYALQSGQLGPLMQHFKMSTEIVDAANSGDMDAFVRAMQNYKDPAVTASSGTAAAEGEGGKSKDKDEDKDEDMSLD